MSTKNPTLMLARLKELSDTVKKDLRLDTWGAPLRNDYQKDATEMANLFQELSNHIEAGGELPDSWKEDYTDHKLMGSIDYEQNCLGCGKKLTTQDDNGSRCYGCGRSLE